MLSIIYVYMYSLHTNTAVLYCGSVITAVGIMVTLIVEIDIYTRCKVQIFNAASHWYTNNTVYETIFR